ncbi:MAG: Recombination protein terminal [Candidatus Parcubacteria bacterium]|jgi:recombinational DNA repair protein (RecF pathway)|nr:Recombination protein terminal [Candidatus Parcubacteria bacterium]
MQHKYRTEVLVLARHPVKEHDASVVLATPDFGIIRARTAGLRKPGSKMAAGLQTLMESNIALIRAKDGWRLAGALSLRDWSKELSFESRKRFARVSELMQRLSHGEEAEPRLYTEALSFADALAKLPEEEQDAAECLAALRVLHILGLDAGEMPGTFCDYGKEALAAVENGRKTYIARVNNGIIASGL